jgi:hypothetical protein
VTYFEEGRCAVYVFREGYKKFDDIRFWHLLAKNRPELVKLRLKLSDYKAVYIPVGDTVQTKDLQLFVKTIILQQMKFCYHRTDKIYTYIQCKVCRNIDRARFVEAVESEKLKNYFTRELPVIRNFCHYHQGKYDGECMQFNRPQSPIVIDDDDDDDSVIFREIQKKIDENSDLPDIGASLSDSDSDEVQQAQEIPPLYDLPSNDENEKSDEEEK